MLIIDTQCHTGDVWEEPIEVLDHQMEANGVSNAVIIQYYGQYDNTYLLDCVRRYGSRFKAVVLLDPTDPRREKTLEGLRNRGASAVRLILKMEWDPADPVYRLAAELGLIVDVVGKAEFYASSRFKQLLDNCPDTQFCFEHLARFADANVDFGPAPHDGFKATLECAKWPNTTIKVPGLGEIAKRPPRFPADGSRSLGAIPPLLEMTLEAFGTKRMMWGSGFPACGGREGYRNTIEWIRTYPAFQDGDDAEWIMGRTAAKVWGFGQNA